jgi:hypothetical protein
VCMCDIRLDNASFCAIFTPAAAASLAHDLHTRTRPSFFSRMIFSLVHWSQKTSPHLRQWCLRLSVVNAIAHSWQWEVPLSGVHSDLFFLSTDVERACMRKQFLAALRVIN